jgi:GNAT superfamily N-acetyltransferase
VEIRLVRPEEAEEAGRLTVAAYDTVEGLPIGDGYRAELADVARRMTHADVLVALDDEGERAAGRPRLLGCVTFVPDAASPAAEFEGDRTAGIRMLGVAPDARGRGLGEALTRACIDRAAAGGCEFLVLHTTRWMTVAQRLYPRLGFERAPELDLEPAPGLELLGYRYQLVGPEAVGSRHRPDEGRRTDGSPRRTDGVEPHA